MIRKKITCLWLISFLLIGSLFGMLGIFPFIPDVQTEELQEQSPSMIGTFEGLPITFIEENNYVRLNFTMFIVEFYKGSFGYNKIYDRNGDVLVYDDRIVLEYFAPPKWKQRGTPIGISWIEVNDYQYNVTRFYDDYFGTIYNITYVVKSDSPIKTIISLDSGQTDEFRIYWVPSGITKETWVKKDNRVTFGDETVDYEWIAFDWEDVYQTFGNITESTIETKANGKKANIYFNIGVVNAGETLKVDPTTVGTYTSGGITALYRYNCFAQTREWVFWRNGSHLVYSSSLDGSTWNDSIAVVPQTAGAWSLANNNTHIFYVYAFQINTYPMRFRTGQFYSNGTIVWQTYIAQTTKALYAHTETVNLGGTNYYLLKDVVPDGIVDVLDELMNSTGRKLFGKWVFQLTGFTAIESTTWTARYRSWRSGGGSAHCDIDVLIRQSDGTLRTTIATGVAESEALTPVEQSLTGTYSFNGGSDYTIVNDTDYLEVDFYLDVTATYDMDNVTLQNSPTANEAVNGGWTNPTYAYSSDDSYAVSSTKDAEHIYKTYGFDSIPSGATVQQVKIGAEAYGDGNDEIEIYYSTNGGSSYSLADTILPPSSDDDVLQNVTVSGLTRTNLLDANFRVKVHHEVTAAANDMYLDWIPVEVVYDPPLEYGYLRVDDDGLDATLHTRVHNVRFLGSTVDEDTVLDGDSDSAYFEPYIAIDTDNYPWIGYMKTDTRTAYVIKSNTLDGEWNTADGFPYELRDFSPPLCGNVYPTPLTSSMMQVVYGGSTSWVFSQLWNGTGWESELNATVKARKVFTSASGNETLVVYLIQPSPYYIHAKKLNLTSWGTEEDIETSDNEISTYFSVTSYGVDNYYVFKLTKPAGAYIPYTGTNVYYKRRIDGSWDGSWTTLSTDTIIRGGPCSFFTENSNNEIGVIWTRGSSSPFEVRHETVVTAIQYSVTFYFYVGGTLLINGSDTANGTSTDYEENTILNITGVPNYSYLFKNHTYDSSSTTDNPFYLTITQAYTTHTYFYFVFDCNYIGLNNTLVDTVTEFKADWSDLNDVEGLSYFVDSTNNTGTWVNGTWSNSWTDTTWSVATHTLNDTEDLVVSLRFYVNDTSGVEYASTFLFFTTQSDEGKSAGWTLALWFIVILVCIPVAIFIWRKLK